MHSFPALSRISVFVLFVSMMNANNVNAEHAVSDRNLSNSLTLSNVYEVVLENDFTLMRSDIIAKSLSSDSLQQQAIDSILALIAFQHGPMQNRLNESNYFLKQIPWAFQQDQ